MALIHPHDPLGKLPVITMSGFEGERLDKVWDAGEVQVREGTRDSPASDSSARGHHSVPAR